MRYQTRTGIVYLALFFIAVAAGLKLPAQTITSFTPKSGPTGDLGSTTITITGTGFSATPSNNIVFFGAVYKPALTATTTELTVTVPTGATYQYLSVVNLETGLKATAYGLNPFASTFYNEGAMSFKPAAAPDYSYLYGFVQPYFKICDFDGDGKPDILYYHKEDETIAILRNTSTPGTISFDEANVFYTTNNGYNIFAFDLSDLNGDGKPDLVTRSTQSTAGTRFSIFPNTSTNGSISVGTRVDVPWQTMTNSSAYTSRDIGLADIDGDGRTDLLFAQGNAIAASWLSVNRNTTTLNNPISIEAEPVSVLSTVTGESDQQGFTFADFDKDGKLDVGIVTARINSDSTYLVHFYNNSTPGSITFDGNAARASLGLSDNDHTPVTGTIINSPACDFDDDGLPDLAVANRGGRNMGHLRNLGVRGANFATRVTSSITTPPSWNRVCDFDGDGKFDMLATGLATNSLYVRRNNSSLGNIAFSGNNIIPVPSGPQSFDVCDLDGDGRPDLIVISSTTLTVQRGITKTKALRAPLPF